MKAWTPLHWNLEFDYIFEGLDRLGDWNLIIYVTWNEGLESSALEFGI